MIELRWRKAFVWGDVPAVSMSNDKCEGGDYVLQYREWPSGMYPAGFNKTEYGTMVSEFGIVEPEWQDVPLPLKALKVTT